MSLIWCTKKGVGRGFRNELVACVACHCRKRSRCKPYAELPMEAIVAANVEAKRSGYRVDEELPLFESAIESATASPQEQQPE